MNANIEFSKRKKAWNISEASSKSDVRDFDCPGFLKGGAVQEPLWREVELRPGLRVSAFEATLSSNYSFSYQKKNEYVDFGFFLEGSIVNNLQETPLGSFRIDNCAGWGGIGFFSEMSGFVESSLQGRARGIHLHILPELLYEFLSDDLHAVHDDLRRLLENQEGSDFYLHQAMDPMVQTAANELFYGLAGRSCSRVYLEGKALELIGLQVMKMESRAKPRSTVLTPSEVEQIQAVQEHLKEKFDSPPSMAELASTHLMSVSKIQSGFQELYGMSVFAFLKEYKLRKARMFFESGDMNVSEVAWALGYTNLSHFSAAFKKRYGVLPKKFLNSVREKKTAVFSEGNFCEN